MTHIDLASGHRLSHFHYGFLAFLIHPLIISSGWMLLSKTNPMLPMSSYFFILESKIELKLPIWIHNCSAWPPPNVTFMQHQPKCWESLWLSQSLPLQHFTVEVTRTKLPLATAFRGSEFNTLIYSILSGRLCGNEAPHHSVFKKKKITAKRNYDTRLSFGSCNHTFLQNSDMFTC